MLFPELQSSAQELTWQEQCQQSERCVEILAKKLNCEIKNNKTALQYPPILTPHYLSLIEKISFDDPIIAQCFPAQQEIEGENCCADNDPLAEDDYSPVPNLVHRYTDRALLITTNRCAMRCRHCMRKRLWHENNFTISENNIKQVIEYLNNSPQVREVIISGGDPLLNSDEFLDNLLQRIFAIKTIELVRIGTRVPVVLPQRLTTNLCHILGKHGIVWIATHFNHPQEFSEASKNAILNLLKEGVAVVNQTVLLKGINDNSEILRQLFTGLLKQRIKPYYLFHGDPIKGTMHFRTGVETGLKIMDELRGKVSGLAIPHFAIDLPQGGGKVRLTPNCCNTTLPNNTKIYKSWDGRDIPY